MRTVIKCHSLPSEISFTGWRHFADGREISLRSRNCDEISPFVSAKYRSKRREISLELSSELSTKVRENKERNSRNSLRLLLHNTVQYNTEDRLHGDGCGVKPVNQLKLTNLHNFRDALCLHK